MYKGNVYLVTARHSIKNEVDKTYGITWNENWNDVYIIKKDTYRNYFIISDIKIPCGLLENHGPRLNYPITVCGYNQYGKYIESNGYVCGRLYSEEEKIDIVYTNVDIEVGMSGGVVLDINGKVLGIVSQLLKPLNGDKARSAFTPIDRSFKYMK